MSERPTTPQKPLTRTALPTTSDMTGLLQHGGAHNLFDADAVRQRLERIKTVHPHRFQAVDVSAMANTMSKVARSFFFLMVDDKPYFINSALIAHITLFEKGQAFPKPNQEINPNHGIPTFMTFVGQFIDHDLTLNMIDLVGRKGNPGDENNPNIASPFIDLDSVYGTRDVLTNGGMWDVFNNTDGTFKLRQIGPNQFDLPRDPTGTAYIFDKRNDENQLILQIHVLLMRLHNALAKNYPVSEQPDSSSPDSVVAFINRVRNEVVKHWQSFIWHEYLPKLIAHEPLNWTIDRIINSNTPVVLGMPHEFSISFRMGHSQLRPGYRMNSTNATPIPLFDNETVPPNDLRGGRPLTADHVIDWPFFTNSAQSDQTTNKIDGKVTSVVFNLPESAIPDNVKGVNNLPQRNLIRSEQVKLACGEDLVDFYNDAYGLSIKALTAHDVEPNLTKQSLFRIDNDGNYHEGNPFRTPLWFYVLKEAECVQGGLQLGPVGGRIIGGVIISAIWYQNSSRCFLRDTDWVSAISHRADPREVRFEDIVNFVTVPQSSGVNQMTEAVGEA